MSTSQEMPRPGDDRIENSIITTLGKIYIRLPRSLLGITTLSLPDSPSASPSAHLYLIEGSFEDIAVYAGTTADWIIKVAHLICCPTGGGRIFTHTTQSLDYWLERERDHNWTEITPGDPLTSGIYEFNIDIPVILSQISERRNHSKTTAKSESNATAFREKIRQRDGAYCILTSSRSHPIASHLIPKRMGTEGVKAVMTRFVGAGEEVGLHKFHPKIGILLMTNLDKLVESYKLGFYLNSVSINVYLAISLLSHVISWGTTYTAHNFDVNEMDVSIFGITVPRVDNATLPRLHQQTVTLSVHSGSDPLPPIGLFGWHYLQCVLDRFATGDYKAVEGIFYYVYPFKTEDDDSDDDSNNSNNEIRSPWPSYHFDRIMGEKIRKLKMKERNHEVAMWSEGVVASAPVSFSSGQSTSPRLDHHS